MKNDTKTRESYFIRVWRKRERERGGEIILIMMKRVNFLTIDIKEIEERKRFIQ
jgi:hypothetical protein